MESKTYPLEKSPLYRLRRRSRLAELLHVPLKRLEQLAKDPARFKAKTIQPENRKAREIHAPSREIRVPLARLNLLLSRLEHPDWLMSGRKGRSYVDNARYHVGARYLLKLDIEDFYNSCRRERIFQYFRSYFLMSPDAASLLADLVSFNGAIPTGSPCSQLIAFRAYAPVFERIYEMARKAGLKFSLYVDDFSFSSLEVISGDFPHLVNSELTRVGLRIKESKIESYHPNDHKVVTGGALPPRGDLKAPNAIRHEVIELLKRESVSPLKQREFNSLVGKLEAIRQVEPTCFQPTLTRLRRTPQRTRET